MVKKSYCTCKALRDTGRDNAWKFVFVCSLQCLELGSQGLLETEAGKAHVGLRIFYLSGTACSLNLSKSSAADYSTITARCHFSCWP